MATAKGLAGSAPNKARKYIAPTLLKDVNMDDMVMQEEIFGPVLPMLTYSSMEELISNLKKLPEHPLALYLFTGSEHVECLVLDNTQFVGGRINNTVMPVPYTHMTLPQISESTPSHGH